MATWFVAKKISSFWLHLLKNKKNFAFSNRLYSSKCFNLNNLEIFTESAVLSSIFTFLYSKKSGNSNKYRNYICTIYLLSFFLFQLSIVQCARMTFPFVQFSWIHFSQLYIWILYAFIFFSRACWNKTNDAYEDDRVWPKYKARQATNLIPVHFSRIIFFSQFFLRRYIFPGSPPPPGKPSNLVPFFLLIFCLKRKFNDKKFSTKIR